MKASPIRPAAALVLALALAAAGCRGEPGRKEVERPRVTGVTIEALAPAEVTEFYEAQGTLSPRTRSKVSARLMAEVKSAPVREGQRVRKGQVLVTLDDRDVRARAAAAREALDEARSGLASARSRRELARVTYERYRSLFEQKALTAQELDAVKTELDTATLAVTRAGAAVNRAEAALSEARVHLGFTEIASPVDGVVTEKSADPGSMAVPGQPLVIIEEPSYRLEVGVDESRLAAVREGMEVEVFIPSTGRTMTGRAVEVVPRVDPSSRTFLVKVELRDEALQSGLYGKARFPIGPREALLVPPSAVVEKGQLTGVYRVDEDGVISYRLIRTGKLHPGGLEVLSGLSAGDRIITGGLDGAVDGGVVVEER